LHKTGFHVVAEEAVSIVAKLQSAEIEGWFSIW